MALQQTSILYRQSSYPHYYLCNYLPVAAGHDTLSRSLLQFKLGRQPDLAGWIDCSLEMLDAVPIAADTIIIRALHHDETFAIIDPPASLDLLGQSLATHFRCDYRPALLQKLRPTGECKSLSRQQRQKELDNIYILEPADTPAPGPALSPATATDPTRPFPQPPGTPPFLIIDDILTTGTTARMIFRAIRRRYPHSPLQVFTLALAGYDNTLNYSTPLRGQNYHLEQGASWTVAEEEQDWYSMATLKARIRANSF
jgi:predicted amidophosphoribosyltransferase